MKRGEPPKRRTPLRRGKGLVRAGRLRQVTPRSRRTLEEMEAATAEVRARSMNRCEAAISPRCTGRFEHRHHIESRLHGDHSAANLLAVCRPCHDHIHFVDPREARERGFLR